MTVSRSHACLAAIGVALAAASVLLGLAVHRTPPPVDTALRDGALSLGPAFGGTAGFVTKLLSPGLAVLTAVALGLRAVLARDVLAFKAGLVLGVSWCTVLVRYGYDRVRPVSFDLPSYPSGHVTAVTAVAFTGLLLCAHLAPRHLRKAVVVGAAAVVLAAACRVVLTMHWFTDTVGAVLGTTGLGLLAALALRLLPAPAEPAVGHGRRVEA